MCQSITSSNASSVILSDVAERHLFSTHWLEIRWFWGWSFHSSSRQHRFCGWIRSKFYKFELWYRSWTRSNYALAVVWIELRAEQRANAIRRVWCKLQGVIQSLELRMEIIFYYFTWTGCHNGTSTTADFVIAMPCKTVCTSGLGGRQKLVQVLQDVSQLPSIAEKALWFWTHTKCGLVLSSQRRHLPRIASLIPVLAWISLHPVSFSLETVCMIAPTTSLPLTARMRWRCSDYTELRWS